MPRERAFLIGLDLRTRSRGPASAKARSGPLTAAAQAARDTSTAKPATKAPDIPEFSAEEYFHIGDTNIDRHYAERNGFVYFFPDTSIDHLWIAR